MGLFNKIKNMFKSYEENKIEEKEEIVEEDGLNPLAIDQEEPSESDVVVEEAPKKKEKKKLFSKKEEEKKSVKVYEKGLTKSRQGFVSKLASLTNKYSKVTEEYFEELEEILIMADIGVNTVMEFMDRLRDRVRKENIIDPSLLKEIIVDELFIIYVNDEVLSNKINYREEGPTIILFVGVNGVGKTTTIAKLAHKMIDEGKKVLMVGADTFRAGAVEQLKEWSEKVGAGFYGKEESDPASVVYDGIELAQKEKFDVVMIDTAGRLQNKVNLMKELEKINKVIEGLAGSCDETLLVIDATTGQNGVSQAKAFKEITNITGIVLTKLDGTAKGGIVLAIKESVGVPVKYIGLGETKDDLQVFDVEKYIYGLFKDMM
ncbi:MAG: signal recognition particle-docking protein FtsY [Bacilli bacterium]|nr:signal recognition particle-docking protein FtsY [Bacilli bacterium]